MLLILVFIFSSLIVSNDQLRGKTAIDMALIQQYVNFADQELLPAVATWVFPTLGLMQYNKQVINIGKQLHCSLEVGCLRHPGASTIGSQLQDGDCTDGWQNLTTQP